MSQDPGPAATAVGPSPEVRAVHEEDAFAAHHIVGNLLVAFGTAGAAAGGLATWVIDIDLGFLSSVDMIGIGLVTAATGAWLHTWRATT